MNAKPLRELLTHIEDNPALLDVNTYGEARPSGIVADLAGRMLLLNGWTLAGDDSFLSPDGTREINRPQDIEDEAQALLGLSDDQLWDGGDRDRLFSLPANEAVARLRELTEEAETVIANA